MQLWLVLGLLAFTGLLQAQTRAWLDRDSIKQGESVTLTIETDQSGSPDYAPLEADFVIGAQSSSRQLQMGGGASRNYAQYAVALTPRRTGMLDIPALRVGGGSTTPLLVKVDEAPVASRDGNAVAFIETEVDDKQPYVQQSVGVVVRLYFATQLASGELVLDTPAAASLQRIGDDRTSVREVGGRR
ncbi:MAG: BatD family protein, partial [Stenotrophomonas sp.]